MAVETTPLGFLKPDGDELVRQGDNVISVNAQLAQVLHAAALVRLGGLDVSVSDADQKIAGIESDIVALEAGLSRGFDGGGPATIYAAEQIIDGGSV